MAVTLFYSYSHKDEKFREALEKHLSVLERNKLIEPWHDRDIEAGRDWEHAINEHLLTADVVLLLISSDFVASNYCYQKEMCAAVERHNRGESVVIPVLVRPIDNWTATPFGKLQAVPRDNKAVTKFDNLDEAFALVAGEIRKTVESIAARRAAASGRREPVKPIHVPRKDDGNLSRFFVNAVETRSAIERAATAPELPAPRIISIEGAPSSGKSWLLRMARLDCLQRGVPVALALCEEAITPIGLMQALAAELETDGVQLPRFRSLADRLLRASLEVQAGSGPGDTRRGLSGSAGFHESMVNDLAARSGEDPQFLVDASSHLTAAFCDDLRAASEHRRVVLMIDKREAFSSAEANNWACEWMRSAPENVVIVVAGRKGLDPNQRWAEQWPDLEASARFLTLEPLSLDDSKLLVKRSFSVLSGATPASQSQIDWIARWSRGNPLAIALAVRKCIQNPKRNPDEILPGILADLESRLLGEISPARKRVLESAAIVRYFDRELLRALAPAEHVDQFLSELTNSAFVEPKRNGWAVLDSVRNTLTQKLRIQDYERFQTLHRQVSSYYSNKLAALRPGDPAAVDNRRRWELERIYHEFEQDSNRGFQLFRDSFETAFFSGRRFDFCRALLNELNSYNLTPAFEHWLRFYEALMAVYLEPAPDKSRRMLEELLDQKNLEPALEAQAREYLATICWYYNQHDPSETERARQLYLRCLALLAADELGRARVLIWLGILLQRTRGGGEYYFQQALQLYRKLGEQAGAESTRAWAEQEFSIAYRMRGRFAEADRLIDSSIEIYRRLAMPFNEAGARVNKATLLLWQGRIREAEDELNLAGAFYAGSSLRLQEKAWYAVGLGDLAQARRDPAAARPHYESVREFGHHEQDIFIQSLGLGGLAACAVCEARWSEALEAGRQCYALQENSSDKFGMGWTCHTIGLAWLGLDDLSKARASFDEGLRHMQEYGSLFGESKLRAALCRVYVRSAGGREDFTKTAAQVRAAAAGVFYDHLALVTSLEGRLAVIERQPPEPVAACFLEAATNALRFSVFLLDEMVDQMLDTLSIIDQEAAAEVVRHFAARWCAAGENWRDEEVAKRLDQDRAWRPKPALAERLRQTYPQAVAAVGAGNRW